MDYSFFKFIIGNDMQQVYAWLNYDYEFGLGRS